MVIPEMNRKKNKNMRVNSCCPEHSQVTEIMPGLWKLVLSYIIRT